MAVTGGPITRITHDAAVTCGNDRPSWSPLGSLLVYHQRRGPQCDHNRILLVNLTTHAEQVVTEDGAFDPADVVSDPDFAPDGQHVVFMARCASWCATQSLNAVVVNLDGSNRRALSFQDGTEGDDRLRECAAAPDGVNVLVLGHTWPGYGPSPKGLRWSSPLAAPRSCMWTTPPAPSPSPTGSHSGSPRRLGHHGPWRPHRTAPTGPSAWRWQLGRPACTSSSVARFVTGAIFAANEPGAGARYRACWKTTLARCAMAAAAASL